MSQNDEMLDLENPQFVKPQAVDTVSLDSKLGAELVAVVYLHDSIQSWKGIMDSRVEMAHIEGIAVSEGQVAEVDGLDSGLRVVHCMMRRLMDTNDFEWWSFAVYLLVLGAAATIYSLAVMATVAEETSSLIVFVEKGVGGMVSTMALV